MIHPSELCSAAILIVDDLETNVMLLEQMLANAGYLNVSSTTDPFAVRALHLANHYDLILLDLQMPGMDGFQVMEGLKDIEPDGYMPVLVITAQPGHKLRALQAGAKDFVGKPFELVEVETRIHNMLEVRLLHRKLDRYNQQLEHTVLERTAELRASEARFQRFTELSSDWYWEQDAEGVLTRWSGPVADMLGLGTPAGENGGGWHTAGRALLDANIADRKPFLDLVYSRDNPDGSVQYLQVSGEPMFDNTSRFTGFRGIGMDVTARMRVDPVAAQWHAAVDALEQGVLLIDPSRSRIVEANGGLCRLSGYSHEQLMALDPAALGLGEPSRLAGVLAAIEAGQAVEAYPAEMIRAGASALPVSVSWRGVTGAGAGAGITQLVGLVSAAA